ncbi:hypothetical protein GOQ27_07010 [Clostridium sp. D2Q-11]|uniref:Uncharacterized protein n=1 Tax=Anaeromonas frigoriresistens TaxID=2683708 RepID=A0A942Z680_9FIRM|nr:hypothetical protein [Anaeromonas frigoriresistens]MBS4538206.1 hypothetical protein [Anaeromonas frigoriresistens]
MDIRVVCNKCRKEAPIDKEKSNLNWKVYDESKSCKCGGEWKMILPP